MSRLNVDGCEIGRFGDHLFRWNKSREVDPACPENGWTTTYGESFEEWKIINLKTKQEDLFLAEDEACRAWEAIKAEYHPWVGCLIAPKLHATSGNPTGVRMIEAVTEKGVYGKVDNARYPGDMPKKHFIPMDQIEQYSISERKPDSYRYIQHLRVCW